MKRDKGKRTADVDYVQWYALYDFVCIVAACQHMQQVTITHTVFKILRELRERAKCVRLLWLRYLQGL